MIEKETCPYCGIETEDPCDEPQNSCEKAINAVFGDWLNDLNKPMEIHCEQK
jgi:hypothetical protein